MCPSQRGPWGGVPTVEGKSSLDVELFLGSLESGAGSKGSGATCIREGEPRELEGGRREGKRGVAGEWGSPLSTAW